MTPQEKELKKTQKRLKKEAKAKTRVTRKQAKSKKSDYAQSEGTTKRVLREKEIKKNLYNRSNFKASKTKEKIDWKLSFKEFPVKMVKEVSKIKWSGKQNLTNKFVQVIIFMLIFAVVFYLIDWGFQTLFSVMHVI
ncbi:preprotein translocase subunit SecE [Mesoplasma whartonense]|uniref:preprotein translocase subunit SecE n=1 Tax=Mesoplasma whartonense TaxID=2878854 RepID=UPI0020229E76|nr:MULTISPECIES: preprotein translocase subunit SecE [unclassified Mesoplasma]MCL8212742.1 hypothetical protein [Mesoplasma sp. JKS002661]MCL8216349.1 hypothetical protein [Mesoplasma sp. JKS002657]